MCLHRRKMVFKKLMNRKIPVALKSGQHRVSRDGHGLTSKTTDLSVPFSKQMPVSEIRFHQVSSWAREKNVTGRQWCAASQTTSGIGWGVVQVQRLMRDKSKTPRSPTVERNLPSSCEKHSKVNSCSEETSLRTQRSKTACPYTSPPKSPFHCNFPP